MLRLCLAYFLNFLFVMYTGITIAATPLFYEPSSNGTILELKLNPHLNKVKYTHANIEFNQSNHFNKRYLSYLSDVQIVGNQVFMPFSPIQSRYIALNGTSQTTYFKGFLSEKISGQMYKHPVIQHLLVDSFLASIESCPLDESARPISCEDTAGSQLPSFEVYEQGLTFDNSIILVALRELGAIEVCDYRNGRYLNCVRNIGPYEAPSGVITTESKDVNYIIDQIGKIYLCAINIDKTLSCTETPTTGQPIQCANFSTLSQSRQALFIPDACNHSVVACERFSDNTLGACNTVLDAQPGTEPVSVVVREEKQVIVSNFDEPELSLCETSGGIEPFENCIGFKTAAPSFHAGMHLSRNEEILWVAEFFENAVSRCDISNVNNISCELIKIPNTRYILNANVD